MKIAIFLATIIFSVSSYSAELSYPKLFFSYSSLYDGVCSQAPGKTINTAWSQEAFAKTQEFESMWLAEAPAFMAKLFELFNKGFQRKEMTATLSVCPQSPSTSDPLILVVNTYLKSYMGDKPVQQGYQFADLVFHELLHTWVRENIPFPSPLYEKYKNEPPVVRNHLHLMAVQQYVYLKLGRKDLAEWIDHLYSKMPSPAYNRAWEIVTKIEGYQPFVDEFLKSSPAEL
ncbi:hypothetical protein ACLVWU_10630 [Bdellovibrio sp. HCB290]|uniref:hypothetical protein n=1 Tax=Bdellovibrio sp. HCB290 TaxID=3394356 RepID=UPI0039B549C3